MANADTIVISARTGGSIDIPNIQSFTLNSGRTNIDDNYRAGRGALIGRVPSSLPTIKVDDYLTIKLQTSSNAGLGPNIEYVLRVTDVRIDYGIVAAADEWTIDLEDAFGLLGRAIVSYTQPAGIVSSDAAENLTTEVNALVEFDSFGTSTTRVIGATLTNANALDVFQALANTEWAFVLANGDTLRWFARNNWVQNSTNIIFADDGTGDLVFQTLTFNTLAEATADKVVVNVRGGSAYTAGIGGVGLEIDTYSQTATEAQNLADYLLAVFSSDNPRPFQLSYMLNFQDDADVLAPISPDFPTKVTLDFRGGTYTAFVLGFNLTANPDMVRATLNLLPSNSAEFFILDDTTFGVLDQNKLGF